MTPAAEAKMPLYILHYLFADLLKKNSKQQWEIMGRSDRASAKDDKDIHTQAKRHFPFSLTMGE